MAKYVVVTKGSTDAETMVVFDDQFDHAAFLHMLKTSSEGPFVVGELRSAGKITRAGDGRCSPLMGSHTLSVKWDAERQSEDELLWEMQTFRP